MRPMRPIALLILLAACGGETDDGTAAETTDTGALYWCGCKVYKGYVTDDACVEWQEPVCPDDREQECMMQCIEDESPCCVAPE